MKVKVSVDNESYNVKPSKWEIAKIKERTIRCWQEIGLEELVDLNGNKGHAIIPAHLVGGMSTDNCAAMQLFVLDFDHDCTFAQIKGKCDAIGLKITYAYSGYSVGNAAISA